MSASTTRPAPVPVTVDLKCAVCTECQCKLLIHSDMPVAQAVYAHPSEPLVDATNLDLAPLARYPGRIFPVDFAAALLQRLAFSATFETERDDGAIGVRCEDDCRCGSCQPHTSP